eukprot:gnl/MRDRNA2_/MRDRNA2_31951_c0_seq1.p1 gnl/MRDRNA2_/MRDRNA2_31951_c0~~gnl/MRDRNA2_/MRDRNA2_31951_c0_seq1.p1  ORF type:complete len:926 (+),score=161.14 gnl/MRDRNA2_/MRDRNA2_31951_c0_seq1:306-2780(+)
MPLSACSSPALHDVENAKSSTDSGDSSDESQDGEASDGEGFRVNSRKRNDADPLAGCAFCDLMCFKVLSVEPQPAGDGVEAMWSRFRKVDAERTELLVQGQCNARGLPYVSHHFLCQGPKPLLPSLKGPFERLLALLAPSVRKWLRQQGHDVPLGQLGPAEELSPSCSVLISQGRGCGKRILWRTVAERMGLHLTEVNCYHFTAQNQNGVEDAMEQLLHRAAEASPAMVCLRRVQALSQAAPAASPVAHSLHCQRLGAAITEALQKVHRDGKKLVILTGSCEDLADVGSAVRQAFRVEVPIPKPDDASRCTALSRLRSCGQDTPGAPSWNVSMEEAAKLTAGLSYADLRSLYSEVACLQGDGTGPAVVTEDAIEKAVKRLQSGSKVAVSVAAKVKWDDIGGMQEAKDEVMDCITLPLTCGHLLGGQKVRSGILLFGPPGTGKTLLAKAVATECRVSFLSVKGPELLSMYIGESEKNVRSLFVSARELAPCVLFFDELDSLAPARGRGSDSGGVMDRVVSQLLTELDTLPSNVFLVGATNRPDLLDRSLCRPGRLDRMVYLGISKDRLQLLRAITRKFDLEEQPQTQGAGASSSGAQGGSDAVLRRTAELCPANLTGADLAALCRDAYSLSLKEQTQLLDVVAASLRISVVSLQTFLQELPKDAGIEAEKSRMPGRSLCRLDPIHPIFTEEEDKLSCSLSGSQARKGLTLYRKGARPGCFLLVHHGPRGGPFAVDFDANASRAGGYPNTNGAPPAVDKRCEGCPQACSLARTHINKYAVCPFELLRVRVCFRHFNEALRSLQPSVPFEDLQRYEALAREYQNTKK